MKQDKNLSEDISQIPIRLDSKTINRLSQYLNILKQWSKKMNLVSGGDIKDIFSKHFIPSFWFYESMELKTPLKIIDIGSGAGFPGLVIKIISPQNEVFLVESNRKKALFLKEVSDQLNVFPRIINDRIENFIDNYIETFDVVVSRSVSSTNDIWNWSKNILKRGGSLYTIKGTDHEYERETENQMVTIFKPGLAWTTINQNLKNKLIIKVTKA